jgi:hypothetical protein
MLQTKEWQKEETFPIYPVLFIQRRETEIK